MNYTHSAQSIIVPPMTDRQTDRHEKIYTQKYLKKKKGYYSMSDGKA